MLPLQKLQSFPIPESRAISNPSPPAEIQPSLHTPEVTTPEAASQVENANTGLAFLEGEPEVLEPSWDFDATPTTNQTAVGYAHYLAVSFTNHDFHRRVIHGSPNNFKPLKKRLDLITTRFDRAINQSAPSKAYAANELPHCL